MKNSNSAPTSLDYSKIASRITHLRNNVLKMTQDEFASVLNISQTYLSLLENGQRQIPKSIIDNILVTFSVSIEWLLYGMGDDNDIFVSDAVTRDLILKTNQDSVISALKKTYHLKQDECDFVTWYLSLPPAERSQFLSCIKTIGNIYSTIREPSD